MLGDWDRFLGVPGELPGELARVQDVHLFGVGNGLVHWDRKYDEFADGESAADDVRIVVVGGIPEAGVEKSMESLDDVAYG